MTKRIFSLLLALVFVLALMPAGAGAAGPTLLTKYFSNGIPAPQAAYLRYNGVDTDHGDQAIQPADAVQGVVPFVELPETALRRAQALAAMEEEN